MHQRITENTNSRTYFQRPLLLFFLHLLLISNKGQLYLKVALLEAPQDGEISSIMGLGQKVEYFTKGMLKWQKFILSAWSAIKNIQLLVFIEIQRIFGGVVAKRWSHASIELKFSTSAYYFGQTRILAIIGWNLRF